MRRDENIDGEDPHLAEDPLHDEDPHLDLMTAAATTIQDIVIVGIIKKIHRLKKVITTVIELIVALAVEVEAMIAREEGEKDRLIRETTKSHQLLASFKMKLK